MTNKFGLKEIALGVALTVGAGGCALDLLPRDAQPGFYRDYKEKEKAREQAKKKEEKEYIKVGTGAWYNMRTKNIVYSKEYPGSD